MVVQGCNVLEEGRGERGISPIAKPACSYPSHVFFKTLQKLRVNHFKLKLGVFITGYTVAMVTCYREKTIALLFTNEVFVTVIVVLIRQLKFKS